jgi:hypothetical protein
MTHLPRFRVGLAALLAAACAACSSSPRASSASSDASAVDARSSGFAALNLEYAKPAIVGTTVHATVGGLTPRTSVDLSWGTVTGGWVIEDYYHFRGKKYSETTTSLGRFSVDDQGRLDASFAVPEDFGGVHEVTVLVDGKPVAQNGIEVTQTFVMNPASGPVGTPIELTVKGLGWRTMESTWVVNWDNQELGFVSRGDRPSHAFAPQGLPATTRSSFTPGGRDKRT